MEEKYYFPKTGINDFSGSRGNLLTKKSLIESKNFAIKKQKFMMMFKFFFKYIIYIIFRVDDVQLFYHFFYFNFFLFL